MGEGVAASGLWCKEEWEEVRWLSRAVVLKPQALEGTPVATHRGWGVTAAEGSVSSEAQTACPVWRVGISASTILLPGLLGKQTPKRVFVEKGHRAELLESWRAGHLPSLPMPVALFLSVGF